MSKLIDKIKSAFGVKPKEVEQEEVKPVTTKPVASAEPVAPVKKERKNTKARKPTNFMKLKKKRRKIKKPSRITNRS